MTRGEKYANKTPFKRFLHKNTGYIIFGIFIVVISITWLYMEDNKVFFENWTCSQINDMDHMLLFDTEHTRYHEIYDGCLESELFTP